MFKPAVFAFLILSSVGVPASAFAQPPAAKSLSSLPADSRLSRMVKFECRGTPLSELLAQLGDDRLTLELSDKDSELKLQASVQAKPLKSVMESLAELLPGVWRPKADGSGYVLEMTPEAKARRKRWWSLTNRERQKAFRAWRNLTLTQMRARFDEGGNYGEGAPAIHLKATMRGAQNFLNALPPGLQSAVAESLDETIFDDLGPSSIGSSTTESGVLCDFATLPGNAQSSVMSVLSQYNQKRPIVALNIINLGSQILVNEVDDRGERRGTVLSQRVDRPGPLGFSQFSMAGLDHAGLPEAVKALGEKAPASWQELAAYQSATVWPNAPAPKKRDPFEKTDRRVVALDKLHRAGGTDYIADYYADTPKTNLSVTFTRIGSVPAPETAPAPPPAPLTPTDERNQFAGDFDSSWRETDAQILLVRDNRWYRSDALEVPKNLLEKWKAFLEADAAKGREASPELFTGTTTPQTVRQRMMLNVLSSLPPTRIKARLDYELEVLNTLTSLQLRNGFRSAIPDELPESAGPLPTGPKLLSNGMMSSAGRSLFAGDARHIVASMAILRFYETLDDRQRDALINGTLEFGTLTPTQKRMALRSVIRKAASAPDNQEKEEGGGSVAPFFLGLSQDIRRLVGSSAPVERVPRSLGMD